MGYTPFNVGAAIRPPRPDDRLAERILHERQVFALLDAVADHPRDHALIRLLYNGGLRVSEAVALRWRNLVEASPTSAVRRPTTESCGSHAGPGRSCRYCDPPMPWATVGSLR
jgi:integrase